MSYTALEVSAISKTFEEGIQNLKLVEKSRVPLLPNEVRVQVKAAAVNFFDLLMLVGKYQSKPELPFVPGSECAGIVLEIGSNVKTFQKGDKVMAFLVGGCFAEEMVLGAQVLLPMPPKLDFEQAAGFGVGYCTAYHGLVQRGNLQKGETLLVTGAAGGMGMAAIQIGKAVGAKVIALVSSETKGQVCKEIGADEIIYTHKNIRDEVTRITKGKMIDVVYENVGGDTFDKCVRLMAGQGRLLVIGFASGTIPSLPANLALIKGFSLVGVRSGLEMKLQPKKTAEMMEVLMQWSGEGKLKPYVSSVVPLAQAQQALTVIADRTVIGKSVITMNKKSSL
jgi:NADPH2:quinone reductase